MNRREFLVGAGCICAAGSCASTAQAGSEVVYRDYSRCLPEYLAGIVNRCYAARESELGMLTTRESIARRQEWVRETFWELVGGRPEATPLNPITLGSFSRPGYRVEKVVYDSRPGFRVPANLYIPERGRPPYPGILFQMGHSLNGKAAGVYQKCCQGLVQLGFVVLAFDPMGQGERVYYPGDRPFVSRLPSADDEHTVPGKQMLLLGETSSRLQVWDSVRSLDFLAAHPLVDSTRLGSTGQSGGGTLTMLLAAVDERLAAAVVSCGNTENFACANFNPPGSTDDAEQNFIDSVSRGFDRWDLLYPLAPKPLLVMASAKDFFGTYSPNYISSGREEFQKLAEIYEVLGRQENLSWFETPLPHALSLDLRLRTYAWFVRWLRGETTEIVDEPPVRIEDDSELWVTPTGSVVTSLGSETPFGMARRAAALIETPESPEPKRLIEAFGIQIPAGNARLDVLGRSRSVGTNVEAVEVNTADHVWTPAWIFLPRQARPKAPLLFVLEPGGRNVLWREDQFYHRLAARGAIVCVPDVRGIGDLNPEFPRGAARHAEPHQREENYAWASLILGRPLLGQRVTDLVTLVEAVRNHLGDQAGPVGVAARGAMTVPGLLLTLFEESVESLYLAGALLSFRNVVETENFDCAFGNFVPGMLKVADLPQLARALSPRRLCMAGTIDAAGRAVASADVSRIYGPRSNFRFDDEAKWNETVLDVVWPGA